MPERAKQIGTTVCAADRSLNLDGGGHGLLDTTHFDTVRGLISPHSASTVASKNAMLTDLFCDNLRRWLAGEQLLNVYSRDKGY